VIIRGYSIGGYWWLLHEWLPMAILLMAINNYLLVIIRGYSIGGYYMNGYQWLLY